MVPLRIFHLPLQALKHAVDIQSGRAVESESGGILGGVGVGKNVQTLTPTSVQILN
jgi:hypothetical protein